VENAIAHSQHNTFNNNTYHGAWRFMPVDTGHLLTFNTWQAAPYGEDANSSMSP
jgi:hypothetical protein